MENTNGDQCNTQLITDVKYAYDIEQLQKDTR